MGTLTMLSIVDAIYSYFNLRCRIKASSLQDKTKGEYGILMNNYVGTLEALIRQRELK